MRFDGVLSRTSNYMSARLDGQEIILQTDQDQYYALNDVGTFIWDQLADPTPRSQLQTALHERYDAPPEQLTKDLDDFLHALHEAELITQDTDHA